MSSGDNLTSLLTSRPVVTAAVTACAAALGVWLLTRWRRSSSSRAGRKVATVTGIYIYPVKSCQPVSVTSAQCLTKGFRFDRQWVVIDRWSKTAQEGTAGSFLNLLKQPKLALIQPSVDVDATDGAVVLRLNAPDVEELVVRHSESEARQTVRLNIYQMEGEGIDCGEAAAAWLKKVTDLPGARLIYMPNSDGTKSRRLAESEKWGGLGGDNETAFANFSPYMMANEKSLDELNSRLADPVSMRCFRPNIVVSSCGWDSAGWSEDKWSKFTIGGGVAFRFLKKCGRCPMTTLDPATGQKLGPEPLQTLKGYRIDTTDERYGQSPCFGVNLVALGEGTVSVGDEVVLC